MRSKIFHLYPFLILARAFQRYSSQKSICERGKFIFRSATSEAWLIVPPLKRSSSSPTGRGTELYVRSCAALWNKKFTSETSGPGRAAVSQLEVHFLLTTAQCGVMPCAGSISIPTSQAWGHLPMPRVVLLLGGRSKDLWCSLGHLSLCIIILSSH